MRFEGVWCLQDYFNWCTKNYNNNSINISKYHSQSLDKNDIQRKI